MSYTNLLQYINNKPVTTRSRTKALQNFSSYTESSHTIISSSTVSSTEPSDVYATEYQEPHLLSSTNDLLSYDLQSSTFGMNSLSASSLDFKMSSIYFEISNLHTLELVQSIDTGPSISHKSSDVENLKMEADCEDHVPKNEDTSSTVYIEKIFTMFTHQIVSQLTNQTNNLRDEIRANELRVTQDNEDFKLKFTEISELHCLLQDHQTLLSSTNSTVNLTSARARFITPSNQANRTTVNV